MKKKILRRVTALCAFILFSALTQTCATVEEKEARLRIDDLVMNGGSAMFTKAPSASETVLGAYEGSYSEFNSGTLTKAQADAVRFYTSTQTIYHPYPNFSANQAAYVILAKGRKDIFDLFMEDLDVRAIKHTGTGFNLWIGTPDKKTERCNYTATTYYYFEGIVVKLP